MKKLLASCLALLLIALPMSGVATDTKEHELVYNGFLYDSAGNAITTGTYKFRFSIWSSEDYVTGDVITATGAIDTGNANYLGWQEVQTYSPGLAGSFSFILGEVTPIPSTIFDTTPPISLQVEVTQSTNPDTSYELIDINTSSSTRDRMELKLMPYAYSSEKLDFRDAGNAPGNIPIIDDTTGVLDASIMPGGLDGDTFTLDNNDSSTTTIDLIFGKTINKSLFWDIVNSVFTFSDSLKVNGDLTVTGTINGTTIGVSTHDITLSPSYANGIFEADGTNNSGSMFELTEDVNGKNKNVLQWSTKQATPLQDYDVVVRYTLPSTFSSFTASNQIDLDFITDGTATDSVIDFTVAKDGTAGDQITATGANLSSNTWTTQSFTLDSGTTWTAGDTMVLRIKMSAITGFTPRIGDIVIHLNQ